jgi:hypothetical protein
MKRLWHRVFASSCVAGLLVVASCAHDDSSIFVRQVLAPTGGSTAGSDCVYKADPTQPFLSSGTVDVGFLASYRPIVLIGSQLISQQKSDSFKTETSRVSLQGATVSVTDTQGTEIASFSTLAAGFVDPASGSSPGWGLTEVTLIDPKTIDALRTQIPAGGTKKLVARFKVFGQTLGGQSVESNESQFPIDVCLGCLVFRPADSTCDATADLGSVAAPCVVGQDQPIDCRLCRGNTLCNN